MKMAPKVWNKRDPLTPKDAIYVGRPSEWGNPFIIGRDGTREDVIRKYKEQIENFGPNSLIAIKRQLKGKDLVCWCAPKSCHADVLLEIANAGEENLP